MGWHGRSGRQHARAAGDNDSPEAGQVGLLVEIIDSRLPCVRLYGFPLIDADVTGSRAPTDGGVLVKHIDCPIPCEIRL